MKTAPSKRTLLGLDAVNFLMADVHTGVGPFVAIYLATSLHWNPRDIGIALSAAGIAGLVAQTPVGAFVDGLRYKREMLAVGTPLLGIGALTNVFFHSFAEVLAAQITMGVVGTFFPPARAGITLGIVGWRGLDLRIGALSSPSVSPPSSCTSSCTGITGLAAFSFSAGLQSLH
jgi:predicted MFS family arabinose efflux permease